MGLLYYQPNPKLDISLESGVSNYTPINSSNIGTPLDLTPQGSIGILDFSYIGIHWSTNYGYFISEGSEGANDSSLKIEGPNFVANKLSKIYWTYDCRDIGLVKPFTIINVQIEDLRNKKILAKSQMISMWKDNDTVSFITLPT